MSQHHVSAQPARNSDGMDLCAVTTAVRVRVNDSM